MQLLQSVYSENVSHLIYFPNAAIECEPLPDIVNGTITYDTDLTANYSLDTIATYTCNAGFFLDISGDNVSAIRTCIDDNDDDAQGIFDKQAPRCVCEFIFLDNNLLFFTLHYLSLNSYQV